MPRRGRRNSRDGSPAAELLASGRTETGRRCSTRHRTSPSWMHSPTLPQQRINQRNMGVASDKRRKSPKMRKMRRNSSARPFALLLLFLDGTTSVPAPKALGGLLRPSLKTLPPPSILRACREYITLFERAILLLYEYVAYSASRRSGLKRLRRNLATITSRGNITPTDMITSAKKYGHDA